MGELNSTSANFRTYLQVVRRRFPWVLAVIVLAVVVAVALGEVQSKKYTASAQLLVQPAGSASSLSSGNQQTISATDMVTELQLLTSGPVSTKAASQLGFQPSISGSEVGETDVLLVSATASTPALAAHVANTYAKDFVAQERASAINAFSRARSSTRRRSMTSTIRSSRSERQTLRRRHPGSRHWPVSWPCSREKRRSSKSLPLSRLGASNSPLSPARPRDPAHLGSTSRQRSHWW